MSSFKNPGFGGWLVLQLWSCLLRLPVGESYSLIVHESSVWESPWLSQQKSVHRCSVDHQHPPIMILPMSQSTSPTNFTNKATMNHQHPPTVLLGMFQSDVFLFVPPDRGWALGPRKHARPSARLCWNGVVEWWFNNQPKLMIQTSYMNKHGDYTGHESHMIRNYIMIYPVRKSLTVFHGIRGQPPVTWVIFVSNVGVTKLLGFKIKLGWCRRSNMAIGPSNVRGMRLSKNWTCLLH